VHTIRDLLLHIPKRYEDRSQIRTLASIVAAGESVLVRANVSRITVRRIRRRMQIVSGTLEDASGTFPVVWFNRPWLGSQLKAESVYSLFGKVRENRSGTLQLLNPEITEIDQEGSVAGIVPVYSPLGPLSGRRLRRLIALALEGVDQIDDPLPESLRQRWQLPSLAESLIELHCAGRSTRGLGGEKLELRAPRESTSFKRLVFDEFLALIGAFQNRESRMRPEVAPLIESKKTPSELASQIAPFSLTGAQERVLGEIISDMSRVRPMIRLLQGDVGSGKTVVAAAATLQVVEAGYQAALMAPTELLAEQHWLTLRQLFEPTPIKVELLTSSCSPAHQKRLRDELRSGAACFVVGTHSLIQSGVSFKRLGLAIIDEQHRFGVAQRHALAQKGEGGHVLVMTATPIPRSLAMTVYGGLAVSIIDELPPGRVPVVTRVFQSENRKTVVAGMKRFLQDGDQGFVICPLIDPSSEVAGLSVAEALDLYQGAFPETRIGVLHGRMDRTAREEVYVDFRAGKIQILVATTIVEVGVDVPEATFIVVESAQRFGLAQLHQLRGRVGRAQEESFCFLLVDKNRSDAAVRRLDAMTASNDGFAIAEVDLEIRGQGEVLGTQQWGRSDLRFADLLKHFDVLAAASQAAKSMAENGTLERTCGKLWAYHVDTWTDENTKAETEEVLSR
jgi:ATP-dependent DNA helicase RecG